MSDGVDNIDEFITAYRKNIRAISMKTATEVLHEEPEYIDEIILGAQICWMVRSNIESILTKDSEDPGKIIDVSDPSLFKDLVKKELENNKLLVFFQDLIDEKTGRERGQDHYFCDREQK
jgi:hypothetical protein